MNCITMKTLKLKSANALKFDHDLILSIEKGDLTEITIKTQHFLFLLILNITLPFFLSFSNEVGFIYLFFWLLFSFLQSKNIMSINHSENIWRNLIFVKRKNYVLFSCLLRLTCIINFLRHTSSFHFLFFFFFFFNNDSMATANPKENVLYLNEQSDCLFNTIIFYIYILQSQLMSGFLYRSIGD